MTSNCVQVWLWRMLHALAGLSVPIFLVLMMGCKKAKATKEDLGPEIDPNAVSQALDKAISGASLDHLDVGQYAEYAITQRVENEEGARILGSYRVEVVKREETTGSYTYTLLIARSERQSDGNWETTLSEEPLTLDKSPPDGLPATSLQSRPQPTVAMALSPFASRPVKRQTYHKLREFTGTLPAPYKVRMRADCGGLSPCEIPVHYVSFDIVEWYDDETYRKLSLDLGFSHATPLIPFGEGFEKLSGLLVLNCRATYIPIEDRNYYVRQCSTLEDFQK
jgi:hypothetical protein